MTASERRTTITAYPDGPLVVRGDFEVTGLDGEPVETGRMAALCRCGRSAQKPLCDNSHKKQLRRSGLVPAGEEFNRSERDARLHR
jgi:CDGSH-type Zn-finger protein